MEGVGNPLTVQEDNGIMGPIATENREVEPYRHASSSSTLPHLWPGIQSLPQPLTYPPPHQATNEEGW